MPQDNRTHVVNDEAGGFRLVFDEIVLPKTGVFKYKISEVNKGDARYEYDDIVYYATHICVCMLIV